MSTIAKQWDSIYQAGAREMYRVSNPRRFVRLTKRLPIAHIVRNGILDSGASVLEVGCGGGQYGIAFALCLRIPVDAA
jgi:2-polyprenyl-3-methyl-5-hydroxy-6-metoxy-1,4-benzoquinol methylase